MGCGFGMGCMIGVRPLGFEVVVSGEERRQRQSKLVVLGELFGRRNGVTSKGVGSTWDRR